MKLHEMENLSFAEIKSRREELCKTTCEAPLEEVAARFIASLADAKMRDEKLGEQGSTIKSLNAAVETLRGEVAEREAAITGLSAKLASTEAALAVASKAVEELKAAHATAEALAKSRRAALADVMKFSGELSGKVAPLLIEG